MSVLSHIWIYPIKSFDGVKVSRISSSPDGQALAGDREFVFIDASGGFVNGKRHPRIMEVRARYDLAARSIHLTYQDREGLFHLDNDRFAMEGWMSGVVGTQVVLAHYPERGIPDDTERPGPTLVSEATLKAVQQAFSELSYEEVLRRFRPNLIFSEAQPAFWEEGLVGKTLAVGSWQISVLKPCARCSVPSRDTRTGERNASFARRFTQFREEYLPEFVDRGLFDHFYYLSVNTRLASAPQGQHLEVGMKVEGE
ncbi:MAG: MOSC N-terminal beta barrel domain-containing protein [Bacteroidota bacterium]